MLHVRQILPALRKRNSIDIHYNQSPSKLTEHFHLSSNSALHHNLPFVHSGALYIRDLAVEARHNLGLWLLAADSELEKATAKFLLLPSKAL